LRPERLRDLVAQNLEEINPLLAHYGGEPISAAEVEAQIEDALAAGKRLERYIGNAGQYLDRAISEGRNVLFEGAQGALLDLDHGTYPYVTSSSTVAGGVCQGSGIGPTRIDRVVGITKAYTTRVGAGPFPTELEGPLAEQLRSAGEEYGATTGRPRRCGWLDVPALRVAIRVNGLDGLALTKLDVLGKQREIKICVAYRVDGREVDELPADVDDLARAEPRYASFRGWTEDLGGARSVAELPAAARDYLAAIEKLTGVPFYVISVGAERAETIVVDDPFA